MVESVLFQCFEYVILLPSCFHGFWWEINCLESSLLIVLVLTNGESGLGFRSGRHDAAWKAVHLAVLGPFVPLLPPDVKDCCEVVSSILFSGRLCEELVSSFLKCLVEFTIETIWAWNFLLYGNVLSMYSISLMYTELILF